MNSLLIYEDEPSSTLTGNGMNLFSEELLQNAVNRKGNSYQN